MKRKRYKLNTKRLASIVAVMLVALISAFLAIQVQATNEKIISQIKAREHVIKLEANVLNIQGTVVLKMKGDYLEAHYDNELYKLYGFTEPKKSPGALEHACRKWAENNNCSIEFDGPRATLACEDPLVVMKVTPENAPYK